VIKARIVWKSKMMERREKEGSIAPRWVEV